MNLTSFLQDKHLTIALRGEIDHHSAKDIMRVVGNKIELYLPRVCVLDFREVGFMDSSGIGVLMGRYKRMKAKGGVVSVCHMNKSIEKVMQLSGLFQILKRADGKRGQVG